MASITQFHKILIIQTAFIGDTILASTLIESIHTSHPHAELHILVKSENESLFFNHPFIVKCWTWNKGSQKFKHLIQLIAQIRNQGFDMVINLHRHVSSGLIAGFSNAKYICGFKQNPLSFLFHYCANHRFKKGIHETHRYMETLHEFSDIKYCKPRLYVDADTYDSIAQWTQTPYYVIAPASVWKTKQAPFEFWTQLCNKLSPLLPVYIIGGHADYNRCELLTQTQKNIVNLCGTLSLLQSAALLSKAKMNYVNDSAPLHLASAMNAPVSAFFCSTTPDFGFGPLSENSYVFEVSNLNCKPCGIHGHTTCPKTHFRCGTQLLLQLNNIPV